MKQSKSVKIKMPAPNWPDKKFLTLCYDHPDQREFVFTIKGRPFSMLSTLKLPVPSTSLIDYNLVRDLGLKMEELQCMKFSYGGSRLRILGKISQTIQTINRPLPSPTNTMNRQGLLTCWQTMQLVTWRIWRSHTRI